MGRKGGNPGNKGGGRKSAYQELKDAQDTQSMFFNELSQEELKKKIGSGIFSIRDRYLLTAMQGDTKILQSLSNKVLPDKIDIKGDLSISQVLDQLDGPEIEGQDVEIKPSLQDQKQEGQVSPIQLEPGTNPLSPE